MIRMGIVCTTQLLSFSDCSKALELRRPAYSFLVQNFYYCYQGFVNWPVDVTVLVQHERSENTRWKTIIDLVQRMKVGKWSRHLNKLQMKIVIMIHLMSCPTFRLLVNMRSKEAEVFPGSNPAIEKAPSKRGRPKGIKNCPKVTLQQN